MTLIQKRVFKKWIKQEGTIKLLKSQLTSYAQGAKLKTFQQKNA